MSWITDNKGAGPWALKRQENKDGYSNNPRWVDTPEHSDKHTPCGYWHSDEYIRVKGSKTVVTDGTQWIEKAPRLNTQDWIWSMLIFNNELYGSTGLNGNLFKWNGTDTWIQMAPQLTSEDKHIKNLVTLNDKIYGAGGRYGESVYQGRLIEWNGTDAWTCVAPNYGDAQGKQALSLCVFNSKIYAGVSDGGWLVEWNGVDSWTQKAPGLNSQYHIAALCVFNNKLYGGTRGGGRLFKWNGTDAWIQVAPQYDTTTNILSLCVFNNKLYGGDGGHGRLLEWNGTDAWVEKAPLEGSASIIDSLCVFNNELFGGGYGYLLKWNGVDAWSQVADRYDTTQDFICSMIVFNDQLYGSTGKHSVAQDGLLLMWDSTTAEVTTYTETLVTPKVGNPVWTMPQ